MFDNLTEKFENLFRKLRGTGKITEDNIDKIVKEIRFILLEADVNYKVVKEFIKEVKEKAIGQEVIKSITPGQMFVKIIHDELVKILGETTKEVPFSSKTPNIILLAGLQGSGKTTLAGKLALFYRKRGKRPLLVACDVYRPAAIEQLQTIGNSIGVEVYTGDKKNPVNIAKEAISIAKEKGYNLVIVDTAGRLHIDEEMMEEVKNIKEAINPDVILYTIDALTGQDAVKSATEFNKYLDFTGAVLTKADADSRGGSALSVVKVTGKPIFFVSTGEKLNDLEVFHPDRMAQRILGMGDIVTLVEKAQEAIEEEEAKKLEEKLKKNKFDLEDFLKQLQFIKKMGPIENILKMIPGLGSQIKNVEVDPKAFKRIEAIILSMTPEERRKPEIINGSRKKRIAKGSGTSVEEVNRLLKQFFEMKKMIKQMNKLMKKGRMFDLNRMFNIPGFKL